MEKLTLILVLMAFGALSFMPAGKATAKKKAGTNRQVISTPANEQNITSIPQNEGSLYVQKRDNDTLPEKKPLSFKNISTNIDDDGTIRKEEVTATTKDGKSYNYRLENGKMVELTANGEKIKEENFERYNGIIDQIESSRNKTKKESLEDQKKVARELFEKQEFITGEQLKLQKEINENLLSQEKLKKDMGSDKDILELKGKLSDLKLQNSDLLQKQIFFDDQMGKLKLDGQDNSSLLKLEKENASMIYEKLAQQDKEHQELFEKQFDDKSLLKNHQFELQNKLQLLAGEDDKYSKSNVEVAQIIYALSKAGVIKNEKEFSFTLNDNELIVDGKKQSPELHENLRKQHIRHKKDHFQYKVNENSRSTDVYVE